MRISPISVNYQNSKLRTNSKTAGFAKTNEIPQDQVSFEGKHTFAKGIGGIFAGLGTLGALGGFAIMTGGVMLVPTLIYGAASGISGAILGNELDKGADNDDDKKDKK